MAAVGAVLPQPPCEARVSPIVLGRGVRKLQLIMSITRIQFPKSAMAVGGGVVTCRRACARLCEPGMRSENIPQGLGGRARTAGAWLARSLQPCEVMQAAAGEGGDLLPGMCALAEAWLADVALAGVRDAPPPAPLLGAWFEDPRVALDLKVCTSAALASSQQTAGVMGGDQGPACALEPLLLPQHPWK